MSWIGTWAEGSILGRLRRAIWPVQHAYVTALKLSPAGQIVLKDLARFCFARAATHNDREQGRRDVWLYINRFLHMSEDELTVLIADLPPEKRYQVFNPGASFLEED